MIELRDLSVRYGALAAVHPVSLAVPSGHLVAVTGPAGVGKTSLLHAIAGVVPHGGEVIVDGPVAIVPQGNGLARILTAAENIALPLAARGRATPDAARQALERVGLADSGNHLVEELSGGQQQRVAVARALALRAGVLLADESTSELDAANRSVVLALFREEAARGAVVLFATNDLEAAEECDAHGALDEGRFTWVRPPGARG